MTVLETIKMLQDAIEAGHIEGNMKMGAHESDWGGGTTVECTGWDISPWAKDYLVLC